VASGSPLDDVQDCPSCGHTLSKVGEREDQDSAIGADRFIYRCVWCKRLFVDDLDGKPMREQAD
jgi:uncharacterized protein with PIN domain